MLLTSLCISFPSLSISSLLCLNSLSNLWDMDLRSFLVLLSSSLGGGGVDVAADGEGVGEGTKGAVVRDANAADVGDGVLGGGALDVDVDPGSSFVGILLWLPEDEGLWVKSGESSIALTVALSCVTNCV